jgi:hypothetical protein
MPLPDDPTIPGSGRLPDDVEKQAAGSASLCGPGLEARKEKKSFFATNLISRLTARDGETYSVDYEKHPRWYRRLLEVGVEDNGIKPVPVEHRVVTQYSNLFTVFFTCLLNVLP